MICTFPLLNKLHYNNSPICHSIHQTIQDNKSRNLNSTSCYGLNNRPKPIRISNQEKFPKHHNFYDSSSLAKEKPKHNDDGFKKTKSRDIKKVNKSISPGGRLSSFLNSLFTNGKKTKISSNDDDKKLKSANASTCLSNTNPSSRTKGSVKFYPVSSLEDCHKNLDMDQQNVEVIIKSINNTIHKDHHFEAHKNLEVIEEDEDEDEGASCASSDLFELDDLFSIGLMELPVC